MELLIESGGSLGLLITDKVLFPMHIPMGKLRATLSDVLCLAIFISLIQLYISFVINSYGHTVKHNDFLIKH